MIPEELFTKDELKRLDRNRFIKEAERLGIGYKLHFVNNRYNEELNKILEARR